MTESKKKMGRPMVSDDDFKEVVSVRMSRSERAIYEKEAQKQGISLSQFTRKALQFFIKRGII